MIYELYIMFNIKNIEDNNIVINEILEKFNKKNNLLYFYNLGKKKLCYKIKKNIFSFNYSFFFSKNKNLEKFLKYKKNIIRYIIIKIKKKNIIKKILE
ncbi:hypothetical protein ACT2CI_00535 [Candidatus Vidania fulgoroideorum]